MHAKNVFFYLGQILKIFSVIILFPFFIGLIYDEFSHAWTFLVVSAIYLVTGVSFVLGARISEYLKDMKSLKFKSPKLANKEAILIVGLTWIVVSMIGALPFVMDGCIPDYIDALFETVSGFTTTGSSILTEIEALPKCMLFWRSLTHWLGGMGILVFILAVMPSTNGSTFNLIKFESPGPQVGKLTSKVKHTATILYLIYLIMTVVEFILLLCGGIGFFHSIIIALSTAGTGGFAATGLSVGEFNSVYIEVVVMAFMFLFSLNFNLYYLMILKHFKAAFLNEELIFYVSYVFIAILAITINLISFYGSFAEALRYSSFAVFSLTSSTGFATADFTQWPQLSQTILIICMFFGAMAGSTGGGFKASRILIMFKTTKKHLLGVLSPNSVHVVKMDKKMLGDDVADGVTKYFVCYVLLFILGVLLLSFDQFDFLTNFTSILTTLNNDGPGFGLIVGPYGSFAPFSAFSKIILTIFMLIGRLEIFPILLLFLPQTWSKKI